MMKKQFCFSVACASEAVNSIKEEKNAVPQATIAESIRQVDFRKETLLGLKPESLETFKIKSMAATFLEEKTERKIPELPNTDGIEYGRAASWADSSISDVLSDPEGRQVFRVFLHDALAEENLSFLESIENLKQMTDSAEKKNYIDEFLTKYSPYINISSAAKQKIMETAASEDLHASAFDLAIKEVKRILENDQFPRFKRSDVYINFLEKLLPRSYAERWRTMFEALLGNQIGRHYFRIFLRRIHAEENLRFWETVAEFKQTANEIQAMANFARTIFNHYLSNGTQNEIFLPHGVRQTIEKRIRESDVDNTLFDDAIKHIEQVLKNDPYVRFLQSDEYLGLLDNLKH